MVHQDEFREIHLPSPNGRRVGDEGVARPFNLSLFARDEFAQSEFISRNVP
jgi:hypothetical protein